MSFLETVTRRSLRANLPEFGPGDRIRVSYKIVEGDKKRLQAFEGVVIRKKKGSVSANFTVRKVSDGVGVERCFPLHSPMIDSIEVVNRGKVRRARLFYLRALEGKKARIQRRNQTEGEAAVSTTEPQLTAPASAPTVETPKAEKPKK